MAKTTWSGPIESTNGFIAGTGSTQITAMLKGTASGVVPTTAAGALADITLTITAATVGDSVVVNAPNSAVETNIEILQAWVSANGSVKVRIRNNHASSALTGSTTNWTYCLIRS